MTSSSPSRSKDSTLFMVFFWTFNFTLLVIVLFGFLPFLGMAIMSDAARGEVPFSILVPVMGLVGVPTTATVMGTVHQRRQAKAATNRQSITLFQIFYGIEAPLLMVFTLRLFFLRDLTPASTFIFISVALGMSAFIHWLIKARHPEQQANWAHLAGLTLMLGLSIYLSAIALFYVPPVLRLIVTGLTFFAVIVSVFILFFPIAFFSLGWVTMPLGMIVLFFKTWQQTIQQLIAQHGKRLTLAVLGSLTATWFAVLLLLQQQPQLQAFQLLEQPPQNNSDRQALLQKSNLIRKGLLNAYLSAYRYPVLDNQNIYYTYNSLMKWGESTSQAIQNAYNFILAPFSYRGSSSDQAKAAELYAKFFDTPIIRGEQGAIQKAVLSTFDRVEAKAGLLDVNAKRVKLAQQDITVTPQGDWAEIELHEVYANTTFDDTEILYYFSLPESASITGLWLGETDDLSQRYEYTVSPRGAAQQVYNNQVRRRVDPALLEQVGPRNYRLRAFPIPPLNRDTLPADGKPDRMHLWMTYKVMKQNNQWMLPVLHERRNIFWTKRTTRTVNGEKQRGNSDWLPTSIPATSTPRTAHQVKLPGGYILANPLDQREYQLPQHKHFAFILDESYSMGKHKPEVEQTFQWLKGSILPTNTADLFLTKSNATKAEKVSNLEQFTPANAVFYGLIQPNQMLSQYQKAVATQPTQYDATILITDSGSYELNQDGEPTNLENPLWLVHLGELAPAYDDATLEAIQRTGGSVSNQMKDVMTRIATQPSLGERTSLLNVVDGYAWFLSEKSNSSTSEATAIAPIAARQWIAQVSQSVKPDQLNQLDAIHAVAKENSIVTPYSSMLVLVNEAQRQELKEAEENSDRFQREIEDQQLPQPQDKLQPVTAVPEPKEWLLIIVGISSLGAIYYPQTIRERLHEVFLQHPL